MRRPRLLMCCNVIFATFLGAFLPLAACAAEETAATTQTTTPSVADVAAPPQPPALPATMLSEDETKEAAPAARSFKLVQKLENGANTYTGSFRALIASGGRMRLEGKITAGVLNFEATIACDGETLRQLTVMGGGKQFFTYDLKALRELIPDFDPVAGYAPDIYENMLRELPAAVVPIAGKVDDLPVNIYTLDAKDAFKLPEGLPGNPNEAGGVNRIRLYTIRADNTLRRVELFSLKDGKESLIMTMDFTDIKAVAEVKPAQFELAKPDDAKAVDGTQLLLEMFKNKPLAE